MDLIDRQAAITALVFSDDTKGMTCERMAKVLDVIKALPSAQPQRMKGRWIEHEWAEEVGGFLISNYECSCCSSWERTDSNYCPNCGSYNGGEQDGFN